MTHEEKYQALREEVMMEWGVDDGEMDYGSTEDEVNREASERFKSIYGFEYENSNDDY